MKIEIEFIKTFLNLLNFYLNLTSTNVKFPTLMICTLLTPRLYKIGVFLCPVKSHALKGKEILESFLFCMYLGSFTLPSPQS